jgi:hypothetical protein
MSRTLALAGVGLLVVILISSIVVAEPINSRFRRLPEGVVPPEADRLFEGMTRSFSRSKASWRAWLRVDGSSPDTPTSRRFAGADDLILQPIFCSWIDASDCFARYPVEPPAVWDALQFVLAGVFEDEPGTGDEVLHGLRGKHFGWAGFGSDP